MTTLTAGKIPNVSCHAVCIVVAPVVVSQSSVSASGYLHCFLQIPPWQECFLNKPVFTLKNSLTCFSTVWSEPSMCSTTDCLISPNSCHIKADAISWFVACSPPACFTVHTYVLTWSSTKITYFNFDSTSKESSNSSYSILKILLRLMLSTSFVTYSDPSTTSARSSGSRVKRMTSVFFCNHSFRLTNLLNIFLYRLMQPAQKGAEHFVISKLIICAIFNRIVSDHTWLCSFSSFSPVYTC